MSFNMILGEVTNIIDTKGICLLCLEDSRPLLGNKDEADKEDSKVAPAGPVSLKFLLRYLSIKLLKLTNFSSSILQSVDNLENGGDVQVTLCGGCGKLVSHKFSKLYQEFEKARLNLDTVTKEVFDKMMAGERDDSRVIEYQRRMRCSRPMELANASIAENLRKEAIRKCSLKLEASIPRVKVKKEEDKPNLAHFRGVSSQSEITSPQSPASESESVQPPPPPPPKITQSPPPTPVVIQSLISPPSPSPVSSASDQDENMPVILKVEHVPQKINNLPSKTLEPPQSADLVKQGNIITIISNEHGKITKEIIDSTQIENVINLDQEFHIEDALLVSSKNHLDLENEESEMETCSSSSPLSTSDPLQDPDQNMEHGNDHDVKHICGICGLQFASARRLHGHKHAHSSTTSSGQEEPVNKKFQSAQCLTCGKWFYSWYTLQRHAKVHTGERPFDCSICGKKSTEYFNHRKHLLAMHPMETLKNELPSGTTEPELNSAVQELLRNIRTTPDKTGKCGCPFCEYWRHGGSEIRTHLLHTHLDKVLERLWVGYGQPKRGRKEWSAMGIVEVDLGDEGEVQVEEIQCKRVKGSGKSAGLNPYSIYDEEDD